MNISANERRPGIHKPVHQLLRVLPVLFTLLPGFLQAQVTGNISAVALSFIVQEPSGIIEVVSERSRDSSRRR